MFNLKLNHCQVLWYSLIITELGETETGGSQV